MTASRRYGCFNHQPFAREYPLTGGAMQKNVFADGACEYSKSDLGQKDPGCTACTHWIKLAVRERVLANVQAGPPRTVAVIARALKITPAQARKALDGLRTLRKVSSSTSDEDLVWGRYVAPVRAGRGMSVISLSGA